MSDTAEVSDASDQPSWPPLYAVCSLILPGQNFFCTRALQDKMLSKHKVFGRGFQCARTPITYAVGSFSFLHVFTYLSPNPLCSWCIRSLMLLVHFLSYMCLFAVSKSSVQLVYSIDDHASQEYFPLELSNADYAARILRIAGHVLREVKSYL